MGILQEEAGNKTVSLSSNARFKHYNKASLVLKLERTYHEKFRKEEASPRRRSHKSLPTLAVPSWVDEGHNSNEDKGLVDPLSLSWAYPLSL